MKKEDKMKRKSKEPLTYMKISKKFLFLTWIFFKEFFNQKFEEIIKRIKKSHDNNDVPLFQAEICMPKP